MHDTFSDSREVVRWVVNTVRNRSPGAIVNVTVYAHNAGTPQHFNGPIDEVAPAISRAVERFPLVEMEAHPRSNYGFFAMLVCACDSKTHDQCRHHCEEFTHRPKVTIIIPSDDEVIGSRDVVPKGRNTMSKKLQLPKNDAPGEF